MKRDDSYWDFIANHLPSYYSDDNVARSDLLWRYVDNEEVDEQDIEALEEEFANKKEMLDEIAKIGTELFKESLEAFLADYAKANRIR